MAHAQQFERIKSRIDSYREEMIDLQRELTAIPALSPLNGGEGEWKKAKYLKSYLDTIGFDEYKEFNSPDPQVPEGSRPNLIVKFHGEKHDRTVWIMAHLDIVPPGDMKLWHSDPYKIKIEGDKIYGRGVEDNQQGLVASLLAVKALKDEKITPSHDVGLVFVADEETGSKHGIIYVLENSDIFKKDDLIVVPDAGNPEGTMIEVAEKTILWLKITTLGKQCHGSTPEKGINSFKAASHLVVKLNQLYQLYPTSDPLFDPPISTFEPTKKEANIPNINTIPGEDIFYIDCRILPQYQMKEVLERIRKIAKEVEREFGVKISFEIAQGEQAAPATPPDAPVVKALERAIADVYQVKAKPMGIGGGTVAAYFRREGFNTAVWAKLDELAHQPNEYCIIGNLLGDAKVFAHILTQP